MRSGVGGFIFQEQRIPPPHLQIAKSLAKTRNTITLFNPLPPPPREASPAQRHDLSLLLLEDTRKGRVVVVSARVYGDVVVVVARNAPCSSPRQHRPYGRRLCSQCGLEDALFSKVDRAPMRLSPRPLFRDSCCCRRRRRCRRRSHRRCCLCCRLCSCYRRRLCLFGRRRRRCRCLCRLGPLSRALLGCLLG